MGKKEILMQPNNIIKGKYACTPVENKLFYKILFNAQKENSQDTKYITTLNMEDFSSVVKNKNELTVANIELMLLTLKQTILEFDYIDENTKALLKYSAGLVGESFYNYNENSFKISMHKILYEHITDRIRMQKTGNGYTPLNLDVLFRFKGVYTQRLYTFFRSWSRDNRPTEVRYKLDDLRSYLKMDVDIYPEYKYFKQNVLKRSIKEINEKGNMHVEIKKETRKNRKVEEIIFLVTDDEPRKYFDKNTKEVIDVSEKELSLTNDQDDFFVPNKKLFTPNVLNDFKKDFKKYDFNDKMLQKILFEVIGIALAKDDEDKIQIKSYSYFKTTLADRLNKHFNGVKVETKPYKTKFHNFEETFTKYTSEELDNIIEKKQKEKFG